MCWGSWPPCAQTLRGQAGPRGAGCPPGSRSPARGLWEREQGRPGGPAGWPLQIPSGKSLCLSGLASQSRFFFLPLQIRLFKSVTGNHSPTFLPRSGRLARRGVAPSALSIQDLGNSGQHCPTSLRSGPPSSSLYPWVPRQWERPAPLPQ